MDGKKSLSGDEDKKKAWDKKIFKIIKKNEFWTRYVQATSYNTNITAVSNELISLKRRIVMNKIKNTLVILITLIVSMNMTVVTKANCYRQYQIQIRYIPSNKVWKNKSK